LSERASWIVAIGERSKYSLASIVFASKRLSDLSYDCGNFYLERRRKEKKGGGDLIILG
jgi:hypothetical protein